MARGLCGGCPNGEEKKKVTADQRGAFHPGAGGGKRRKWQALTKGWTVAANGLQPIVVLRESEPDGLNFSTKIFPSNAFSS
jgi:hypothetical protein